MPDLAHWSVFLAATIGLLVIPGHSVMYVVTRAIEAGYRGAIFSSLGLALGDLLQVLFTTVGLSVLLTSSVLLFTTIKYAGAGYLIVFGLSRLLKKNRLPSTDSTVRPQSSQPIPSGALILQGFFALNPKTTLFFLALFPQLVSDHAGPPWFQILLFGCAFVTLGFMTNFAFGCLGGKLSSVATRRTNYQLVARYISGVVLIALGVAAALDALVDGTVKSTN